VTTEEISELRCFSHEK